MKKLILTALLAAAAASASAAGNDRISRLEAEIQELKQRISVLEKQQGIAAPRTPAAAPAPAVAPQPVYRQPEKAVEAPAAQAQTPRTPAAAPVLKQGSGLFECGVYVQGQRYEARNRSQDAARAAAKSACREEQGNSILCAERNILCTEL